MLVASSNCTNTETFNSNVQQSVDYGSDMLQCTDSYVRPTSEDITEGMDLYIARIWQSSIYRSVTEGLHAEIILVVTV